MNERDEELVQIHSIAMHNMCRVAYEVAKSREAEDVIEKTYAEALTSLLRRMDRIAITHMQVHATLNNMLVANGQHKHYWWHSLTVNCPN